MEKTSFVGAMLKYFGRRPGQTALEFKTELEALTPADREYFIRELRTVGYDVTPTAA